MARAAGKRITKLQLDILELWAQGISDKDISEKLECTIETIRNTKKIESLKKMYSERQSDLFVDAVPFAVQELVRIVKSPMQPAMAKIAAAKEIIDRAGLSTLLDNTDKEIKITVSYE